MLKFVAGVDLEAISFFSSLTIFISVVNPWCLGLVQISLPDIVALRGLQEGARGFQGVSSLRTQLSPVSNLDKGSYKRLSSSGLAWWLMLSIAGAYVV